MSSRIIRHSSCCQTAWLLHARSALIQFGLFGEGLEFSGGPYTHKQAPFNERRFIRAPAYPFHTNPYEVVSYTWQLENCWLIWVYCNDVDCTHSSLRSRTEANYHRVNTVINPQFIISSFFLRSKRKQRRRTNSSGAAGITILSSPLPAKAKAAAPIAQMATAAAAAAEPDPDDPKPEPTLHDDDNGGGWKWRFAKYSFPMQLAVVALLCAACFFEPNCCDGLNSFAWSLSPQLRYVQGPPPTWMARCGSGPGYFRRKRSPLDGRTPTRLDAHVHASCRIRSGPLLVSTLWIWR